MTDITTEITLKEACNLAEVTPKTIYNWCELNHFKFRRAVNRRLWIDKQSFFEFINGRLQDLNEDNHSK